MTAIHLLVETGRASRLSACTQPFANGEPGTENRYDVTCGHCLASPAAFASAIREASAMLDREEHRYVERYVPCPNGCQFEYLAPHRIHVRLAGPDDCDDCDEGIVEDEDAVQINPLLVMLERAAAHLTAQGPL